MTEETTYHKPTFDNIPKEKRDKILSVALKEFASNGFESTNINTIAKNSGVSVGAMYKYFESKSDLFLTTVNQGIQTLESTLNSIASDDDDVMLKLEKLIRAAVDYSKSQSDLIKLYLEITTESNAELIHEIVRKTETVSAKVYIDTIKEGQKTGEIRKDIPPEIAAFLLDNIIMIIQFSYSCDYYGERYKIFAGNDILDRDEEAIQSFLKFVKAALRP